MNAPVTPKCDGCGCAHAPYSFAGHDLCLSCVKQATDEHEDLEPDTSASLALEDRRGAV